MYGMWVSGTAATEEDPILGGCALSRGFVAVLASNGRGRVCARSRMCGLWWPPGGWWCGVANCSNGRPILPVVGSAGFILADPARLLQRLPCNRAVRWRGVCCRGWTNEGPSCLAVCAPGFQIGTGIQGANRHFNFCKERVGGMQPLTPKKVKADRLPAALWWAPPATPDVAAPPSLGSL